MGGFESHIVLVSTQKKLSNAFDSNCNMRSNTEDDFVLGSPS